MPGSVATRQRYWGLARELIDQRVSGKAIARDVMADGVRANAIVPGARGLGLRAGDSVMLASRSILLRPMTRDTSRATFTRLGAVSVRFV